jgi:hypothetical protein
VAGKRDFLRQPETTGNFRMAAMRNLRVIGKPDFLKVASAAGGICAIHSIRRRFHQCLMFAFRRYGRNALRMREVDTFSRYQSRSIGVSGKQ